MAARVCRGCDLKFPDGWEDYRVCCVCGEKTVYVGAENPQPDWEKRAERLLEAILSDDPIHRQVITWRVHQLYKLGLPWEFATELASRKRDDGQGGYQVDLERMRQLIAAGCTPLTAARICG